MVKNKTIVVLLVFNPSAFISLSGPVYLLKPLTPYFPSHFLPLYSHGSNQRKRGVSARVRALINCIDTKAKCRHLKIWPVQRLCGRCFIRVHRLEIQSVMVGIFEPALWVVGPLTLSLVQLSPPPPLHYVKKYTVYTYTVCKGRGIWVSGPQTDKHLPQSPFTGQFFLDDDILHCLLSVLSVYG